MITLVTGGIKSGKTDFATKLALKYQKRAYLATAEPFDGEMKKRIEKHKKDRAGRFFTIEEPIKIYDKLLEYADFDVVVIDCMTTWLGNLFHHCKDEVDKNIELFLKALKNITYDVIIVTNEVGFGVIPVEKSTREYVDKLGILNQKIANLANNCYLLVSGISLKIK